MVERLRSSPSPIWWVSVNTLTHEWMSDFVPRPFWVESLNVPHPSDGWATSYLLVESLNVPQIVSVAQVRSWSLIDLFPSKPDVTLSIYSPQIFLTLKYVRLTSISLWSNEKMGFTYRREWGSTDLSWRRERVTGMCTRLTSISLFFFSTHKIEAAKSKLPLQ